MHEGFDRRVATNAEPCTEGVEVEVVQLHPLLQCRVGGVDHLEAAVQQEAVHLVGPLPAADVVRRFQHGDLQTLCCQAVRALQPGQTSADHNHVLVHRAILLSS